MSKIPVEYSENNSGGHWWLTDKDWQALKDAGWKTFDYGDFAYRNGHYIPDKDGLPSYKSDVAEEDQDVNRFPSLSRPSGRSHYAYKLFDSIQQAIAEFERITGQDVTEEGCNCCGAPHTFRWGKDIVVRVPVDQQDYHYASGEDLLEYMYPDENTHLSKRELLERQRKDGDARAA